MGRLDAVFVHGAVRCSRGSACRLYQARLELVPLSLPHRKLFVWRAARRFDTGQHHHVAVASIFAVPVWVRREAIVQLFE